MPDLLAAVSDAADRVRGKKTHRRHRLRGSHGRSIHGAIGEPGRMCALLLRLAGTGGGVPRQTRAAHGTIEALLTAVTEALLTELLAGASED